MCMQNIRGSELPESCLHFLVRTISVSLQDDACMQETPHLASSWSWTSSKGIWSNSHLSANMIVSFCWTLPLGSHLKRLLQRDLPFDALQCGPHYTQSHNQIMWNFVHEGIVFASISPHVQNLWKFYFFLHNII